MNDFGIQLLIAFIVMCAIFIPTYLYKYKKYKKEGKSIKYLEFKIAIIVAIPIYSILLLLRNDLSFLQKIFLIIIALIGMIAYAYFIHSARRSFRKTMGLPLEDEHTGEVIKDEDKRTGGKVNGTAGCRKSKNK